MMSNTSKVVVRRNEKFKTNKQVNKFEELT